tara:strand:- start:7386 stop:8738 length:1353 start_codon:yes stop_codon:yes gene_type:complete
MAIKKFENGGDTLQLLEQGGAGADIITGGIQAIAGVAALRKANRAFDRAVAAAPSLETPAQYYENYRNAYDSEIARMESDAIQTNLATSIQALQGAGGRALVGGLSAQVAQSEAAQNRMLAQERALRMRAGTDLARAEERTRSLKYRENVRQQQMAQQAAQAARQNVAAGLTNVATGVMFGGVGQIGDAVKKGLGVAKKGLGAAKTAFSKIPSINELRANREIRKTRDAIGYQDPSDNMTQFVNNFRQNYMLGDMTMGGGAQAVARETGVGIYNAGVGMRPELSVTPNALNREAMNAARKQEFIDSKTSEGVARQSSTSVGGFSGTGEMTAEQKFRLGEVQSGPSPVNMDTESPYIYGMFGERMGNPYYGLTPSQVLGVNTVYNQGGMVTKGAFNHKTNPIDIVQNGVKVGEATGNEYIINPSQAAEIAKESSYARKLFRRFEKKAKNKK